MTEPTRRPSTGPNGTDQSGTSGAHDLVSPARGMADGTVPFTDGYSPASPYTVISDAATRAMFEDDQPAPSQPLPPNAAPSMWQAAPTRPLIEGMPQGLRPTESDLPAPARAIPTSAPQPAAAAWQPSPAPVAFAVPVITQVPGDPSEVEVPERAYAAPQPVALAPQTQTEQQPYAVPWQSVATQTPPSAGSPPAPGHGLPERQATPQGVPAPPLAAAMSPYSSTEPGAFDVPIWAKFGHARPRKERVGRGLLFALLAVVGGCVLAAAVYHVGYVASIVALAMGAAGIFLYAKGAGAPPKDGALALILLLAGGILLAWVCSVGTELYFYYVDQTGSTTGALGFAVQGAFSFELFKATFKDFLIFVGFGALGIVGVVRRLIVGSRR